MKTMSVISICDLVITVAYFSIPLQLLVSIWQSPRHRKIPRQLILTLLLFAAFIFLCGSGHLMRYFGMGNSPAFVYVNVATAVVSIVTALCLVPLIPCMFSLLDESINKLTNESKDSKSKLFTFMAFLCHEIRNPLFATTSSAEFLKDTHLHPEQAEEVSSICDSSLLMLRLVNDVLDLSKLESGKLELESREFDLHSMLKRLADNMKRQIDRKHKGAVNLLFELDRDVPRVICGDSTRILQIIYNLLSNSIKFTSKGKIELIVKLANADVERAEEEAARKSGACTVHMSNDSPIVPFSSDMGGDDDETPTGDEDNQQLFSMALLGDDSHTDVEAGDVPFHSLEEDMMVLSVTVGDTGIGIAGERLATIFEPYTQAKLSDFRQHGGTGLGLSIISSLMKTMGGNVSVTSKAGEGSRFHLKIPVRVPRNPNVIVEDDDISESHDADSNQSLESRRLPVYEDVTEVSTDLPIPPGVQRSSGDLLSPSGSHTNGPTDLLSRPGPVTAEKSFANAFDGGQLSKMRSSSDSSQTPTLSKFNFQPQSNLVLVVDDNSVNRKILGKMLTTYNIEYETASNGREAVDILLASRNKTGDLSCPQFGLVFMDVSMPIMDGNSAIKAIREANISVPIVALSANVLTQERDRTICLGANESHTKPILRADLHRLCTKFLCRNGHQNHSSLSEKDRVHDKRSSSCGSSATESETSVASGEV